MTRLGYIPDEPDARDLPFGLSESAPPSSYTLRPLVFGVYDQGDSETCVSNAIARAIQVQQSAAHLTTPPLSRLSINWHACMGNQPGFNGGCRIRDAIKYLQQLGAPDESVWPFDLNHIATHPSWAAERQGFDRHGIRGYYRVSTLDGIRSAVSSGKPVVAGWAVDQAFLSRTGPSLVSSFGEPIGGHAMCIVGYDPDSFELVNSWGTTWRDGGFVRLSNDLTSQASDLWAIDLAS